MSRTIRVVVKKHKVFEAVKDSRYDQGEYYYFDAERLDLSCPELESTPKTLQQAILNSIKDDFTKAEADSVHKHIQDFLAQRFSVAMLQADDSNEADRLRALFKEIVRREGNE